MDEYPFMNYRSLLEEEEALPSQSRPFSSLSDRFSNFHSAESWDDDNAVDDDWLLYTEPKSMDEIKAEGMLVTISCEPREDIVLNISGSAITLGSFLREAKLQSMLQPQNGRCRRYEDEAGSHMSQMVNRTLLRGLELNSKVEEQEEEEGEGPSPEDLDEIVVGAVDDTRVVVTRELIRESSPHRDLPSVQSSHKKSERKRRGDGKGNPESPGKRHRRHKERRSSGSSKHSHSRSKIKRTWAEKSPHKISKLERILCDSTTNDINIPIQGTEGIDHEAQNGENISPLMDIVPVPPADLRARLKKTGEMLQRTKVSKPTEKEKRATYEKLKLLKDRRKRASKGEVHKKRRSDMAGLGEDKSKMSSRKTRIDSVPTELATKGENLLTDLEFESGIPDTISDEVQVEKEKVCKIEAPRAEVPKKHRRDLVSGDKSKVSSRQTRIDSLPTEPASKTENLLTDLDLESGIPDAISDEVEVEKEKVGKNQAPKAEVPKKRRCDLVSGDQSKASSRQTRIDSVPTKQTSKTENLPTDLDLELHMPKSILDECLMKKDLQKKQALKEDVPKERLHDMAELGEDKNKVSSRLTCIDSVPTELATKSENLLTDQELEFDIMEVKDECLVEKYEPKSDGQGVVTDKVDDEDNSDKKKLTLAQYMRRTPSKDSEDRKEKAVPELDKEVNEIEVIYVKNAGESQSELKENLDQMTKEPVKTMQIPEKVLKAGWVMETISPGVVVSKEALGSEPVPELKTPTTTPTKSSMDEGQDEAMVHAEVEIDIDIDETDMITLGQDNETGDQEVATNNTPRAQPLSYETFVNVVIEKVSPSGSEPSVVPVSMAAIGGKRPQVRRLSFSPSSSAKKPSTQISSRGGNIPCDVEVIDLTGSSPETTPQPFITSDEAPLPTRNTPLESFPPGETEREIVGGKPPGMSTPTMLDLESEGSRTPTTPCQDERDSEYLSLKFVAHDSPLAATCHRERSLSLVERTEDSQRGKGYHEVPQLEVPCGQQSDTADPLQQCPNNIGSGHIVPSQNDGRHQLPQQKQTHNKAPLQIDPQHPAPPLMPPCKEHAYPKSLLEVDPQYPAPPLMPPCKEHAYPKSLLEIDPQYPAPPLMPPYQTHTRPKSPLETGPPYPVPPLMPPVPPPPPPQQNFFPKPPLRIDHPYPIPSQMPQQQKHIPPYPVPALIPQLGERRSPVPPQMGPYPPAPQDPVLRQIGAHRPGLQHKEPCHPILQQSHPRPFAPQKKVSFSQDPCLKAPKQSDPSRSVPETGPQKRVQQAGGRVDPRHRPAESMPPADLPVFNAETFYRIHSLTPAIPKYPHVAYIEGPEENVRATTRAAQFAKSDEKNKCKFHTRTLLMGKEVPPRYIPLDPIHWTKPMDSRGQPRVPPTDPRIPHYRFKLGVQRRKEDELIDSLLKV